LNFGDLNKNQIRNWSELKLTHYGSINSKSSWICV
jgi:hypothetical protein